METIKKENSSEITMRISGTTYVIGLYYKQDTKVTMDEKVRKMIRKEIQNGESV